MHRDHGEVPQKFSVHSVVKWFKDPASTFYQIFSIDRCRIRQ